MRRNHLATVGLATLCFMCGPESGFVSDAPDNDFFDPFEEPTDTPPTGSRWDTADTEDGCGRVTRRYRLVDEICGADGTLADPADLQVTMFRDGQIIDGTLYAVDATHLWALDIADPTQIARRALHTGPGQPLAVETEGSGLLIASGRSGLWRMAVSQNRPPVQTGHIPLPGVALDVALDEAQTTAWVAAGGEGVFSVDLTLEVPEVSGPHITSSMAVSAKEHEGLVYVSTCTNLDILESGTGQRIGTVLLPDNGGTRLMSPGRDVVVSGDVAYVAAGRYGVIAIDVSDPTNPSVLGSKTLRRQASYYASGLKVDGDRLIVAAGEWGIDVLDIAAPRESFVQIQAPTVDAGNEPVNSGTVDEEACSDEPPWMVEDWQETWRRPWNPPPPRGRDPIQILAEDGLVYAFGDARRLGIRAIEVKRLEERDLSDVGRYEEPMRVLGVAADRDRVLALGPAGGLLRLDELGQLQRVDTPIPAIEDAIEGAFLPDGRWVVATRRGTLFVEGLQDPIFLSGTVWPGGLALRDHRLIVQNGLGIVEFDVDANTNTVLASLDREPALPLAITTHEGSVFAASPEWLSARQIDTSGMHNIEPHGAFDGDAIANIERWRSGLPRRLMLSSDQGVVEVASLSHETVLAVHGQTPRRLGLPRGLYLQGAASGNRVVLVAANPERYVSQVVVVTIPEGAQAKIEAVHTFTGAARDVAIDGDRVYVADADRGVRVFMFDVEGELHRDHIIDLALPTEEDSP